jgi:hypothetical protein
VKVAASASSCRPRKRAIVAWSGIRFAAITRKANILATTPLDPAARALADRVRVQQQRDHHRRLERRPPPAVLAIDAVEAAQIDPSTASSTNHAR